MRRRRVLLATGVAAIAGCLDGDEESNGDDGTDGDDGDDGTAGSNSLPIDARTVEAPGSAAGSVTVPRAGQVILLNFTRLFCPTSEGAIGTIGDARAELAADYDVGPDGEVRFVSAIDPASGPDPSDEELADWWTEHGGEWTIGIDEDGALNEYYEVSGFPTIVALDGDGEVHWRDTGSTAVGRIVSGVERALGADPDVVDPDDEAGAGNDTGAGDED